MPESTLRSVVLPAPFGPITACTAPRAKPMSTASSALTPPNRLERFSARSSKRSPQGRYDPSRQEDHGQHQDGAEHHHLVFLEHREHLGQDGEDGGADYRAVGGRHAAENHHGD